MPLLDNEIVDLANSIPTEMKQKGATGKWIFKKAMEPFLPKDIISEPFISSDIDYYARSTGNNTFKLYTDSEEVIIQQFKGEISITNADYNGKWWTPSSANTLQNRQDTWWYPKQQDSDDNPINGEFIYT